MFTVDRGMAEQPASSPGVDRRTGRAGLPVRAVQGPLVIPRAPHPDLHAVLGSFRAMARVATARVRPNDLGARDEAFISDMLPLMSLLYDSYFRCETELDAEIPDGPVLLVANHNGMTGTPDMFCHMAAFWRRYGARRVAYGLMHDMPFSVPAAGAWLNASGAIAANPRNAMAALDRGACVLVFPGGDIDACKPFRDRYRIDFGTRRGFIRIAIRTGIPIVPVVSVGGHESLFLFTDGRGLARRLGLDKRFRSNVAPLGFALPLGVVPGVPYPHFPPPVKVHTKILAPIRFDLASSAADDAQAVESAYDQVVTPMRNAMIELRRAGRHGLFPRDLFTPGMFGRALSSSRAVESLRRAFS